MTPDHVKDITTEDFPTAVLQRSREVPVVVDFWAEWCGPCKILGPLLEDAAARAHGAFELVKLDVDQNQAPIDPVRRARHPDRNRIPQRRSRVSFLGCDPGSGA